MAESNLDQMSALQSPMDRRVKPGDDELFRCRDAPSHPSLPRQEKPSQESIPKKLPPLKEGRRSAEKRTKEEPHRKAMQRAPFLLSSHCGRTEAQDLMEPWTSKNGAGALAFRRPTAASEILLSARPGPRFLEPPDANGRTLSGTSAASTSASLVTNPKGGEFGGQVGYNYQFSSWVAGVEADLSWTNFKGSSTAFGFAPVTGFPADFRATTATASEQLRYFGTVRGRFGYLVTNPLLAYVTGGLAYGNVQSSTALTQIAGGPGCVGCLVTPGNGSASTTRTGWTVGGGLEYLLPGSWTVRAEYLYYDLGRTSYGLTPLALSQGGPPFSIVGVTSNTSDFRGSIARVGLNRLFN